MVNINIQDKILNNARKEKVDITVYLTNGVPIHGKVQAFDNFTVLLKVDIKQNLIYKHAISTIVPAKPLKYEDES
jgi:host factor-I protein